MSTGNWETLFLKELHRNSDKIDEIKDQIDSRISKFETRIQEKLTESSQQHQTLFNAQKDLQQEHKRMNDLLDVHIQGVQVNKKRLDEFEYRILPVLEKLEPVIKDFDYRQTLKEKKRSNYKEFTVRLTIISIFFSLITGILKVFGVF